MDHEVEAGLRAEIQRLRARVDELQASSQRESTTAHRQLDAAENELRERERRFRHTFEQAAVGISHVAPDGRWLRVNRKLCEILGYSREELLDRTFQDITHPDDLQPNLELDRQVLDDEIQTYAYEKRYIRKDGSEVWIRLTVSLVRDAEGRPEYFISVIEDISAQRTAQEDMLEGSRRLETLFRNLPGMAYRCRNDRNWTMEFLSDGCLALTGHEPGDLIGNHLTSYGDLIHQDDRQFVWNSVQAAVGQGRSFEVAYRIRTAGKLERWVWERGRAVIDDEGSIVALEGVITDITDQKRSEAERLELENRLRQSQKLEAVGQLAGGVAHDFNNLLSVILGYGEILLERLPPGNALRGYIVQIVVAGKRSAALTRQLLAFSRRQTLQPEVLDLNDVILRLDEMLRRLIGEDIQLELALKEDLPRVKLDRGQVEQVVMNLAVNARDAMPRGGTLTIETDTAEIDEEQAARHESALKGDYVMLAVSDTGCGMDKKTLEQVFEPFFTTKEKGKGTGLGLSTVYGIVKQSGGNIWAYSEPGRGSSFKLYFRKDGGPAAPVPESAKQPEVRGHGEQILVVEDEEAVRLLVQEILSDLGYEVVVASNGAEALEQVIQGGLNPDLVISDVVMPGMSGAELADHLRRKLPELKVLFMSGYTDSAIVHHGILNEGTPFLAKPFNIRQLSRKVRELLPAE